MARAPDTTAIQNLVEAVQAVLSATPGSPSPELIDTLGAAFNRARQGLPPQVFYAAVEQAPAAISITDTHARILYANPVFEQVTGHRVADVIGRNESILSDKSTPRHIYERLWGSLLNGKSWSGIVVNRRKNKERYLAELTVSPVFDADGNTIHYLGIHRDVTDVHRLEKQVLNQKQLIESIVDAASTPMALLDEGGEVVLDNLAYKTLAEDLGEEPARSLLSQLNMPVDFSSQHPDGEAFQEQEIALEPRLGPTRWFVCSGSWLHESDEQAVTFFRRKNHQYLLVVVSEVTRLKEQQEAVRRSAMQALVTEEARVQALREAISGAEYQLQGPFNLLKAAVRMLERKGQEEHESLIQVLHQALDAGGQALDRLHDAVPRGNQESVSQINLNEIVRDGLSLATERMLSLGVVIDWRPASELPHILGYENRLRAMVKQLLDNAIDALQERGNKLREIYIVTESDGDAVKLRIEDSGPGIADEIRSRVFEPFFTTRGDAGHVGMGLPMVREIINQHSGTVEISRSGQGCAVQIQLPTEGVTPVGLNDMRGVG